MSSTGPQRSDPAVRPLVPLHGLGRTPLSMCELADLLDRTPIFRALPGPAGPELRTGAAGVPAGLPPVPFALGVIIGRRGGNPLFARAFAGPNDGKVGVARAAVAGMHDLCVVERGHTFVMDGPDVVEAVFHFLEHGRFPHGA